MNDRKKRLEVLKQLAESQPVRNPAGEIEISRQGENADQNLMEQIRRRKMARTRKVLDQIDSGEYEKQADADAKQYIRDMYDSMTEEEADEFREKRLRAEREKRGLRGLWD